MKKIKFSLLIGIFSILFNNFANAQTANTISNGSFETPNIGEGWGAFQTNPSGSDWTFDGAGIMGNGSAYRNPDAPDGSQVAYLQGSVSMSQTVSFTAGTYIFAFTAAKRGGGYDNEIINVLIDGNQIVSYNISNTSYQSFTTPSFTVTDGNHIITFSGEPTNGDCTAFVDNIILSSPDNQAPTAPNGLTAVTLTQTDCELSWTPSTDNVGVASYDIYDGNSLLANTTGTDYYISNLTSGYHSITIKAEDGSGNYSNASLPLTFSTNSLQLSVIKNGSLEASLMNPGSYNYGAIDSYWNFPSSSGILANGSAFGNPNAPSGNQVAFVQSLGTMSQTVIFPVAGTYVMSFMAAKRNGDPQVLNILIDGTIVSTITISNDSYQSFTLPGFTTTAGTKVLTIAGQITNDVTAFLDNLTLIPVFQPVITVGSNANISDLSVSSNSDISVSTGAELTLDTTSSVNSITVTPGAKLTLNSGSSLTTINGITLESDLTGNGTFIDKNSMNIQPVFGIVQQYLPQGRNWYLSTPVTSANTSSFIDGSLATSISYWDEVGDGSIGAWVNNYSGAMIPGKGYVAVSTSGSGTNNASITGTLNSGDVSITLTRTGTGGFAGYNLIANPYPSYLNAMQAINANSNIQSTIWYRTHSTSGTYYFETVNTASGEGTNVAGTGTVTGYVPPMQAFWVRTNLDNQTVTFTNSMRYHANPTINSSTITTTPLKVKSQYSTQRLRLQVTNGINADETVIYTNPNASNAVDIYDSPKRSNNLALIPEIFTIAGTEQLVINGMNNIVSNQEIPLGFTTGQSNAFSIKATEVSNFDASTQVILKDNQTNTQWNLTDGSAYNFSSDITSSNVCRFSIIFKSADLSTGNINKEIDSNSVLVYRNDNNLITVNFINGNTGQGTASVYNAVGRKLIEQKLTSQTTVLSKSYTAGMYLVSVTVNGKSSVQKVIIK